MKTALENLKEEIELNRGWVYFPKGVSMPDRMSGWKLHVFGDTVEDSVLVSSAIEEVMRNYGISGKAASKYLIERYIGVREDTQYGKIVTLYIPTQIFKEGILEELIIDLKNALKRVNYEKKGTIYGDNSIDGTLHYRYELWTICNPSEGVTYMEYAEKYRPNDGLYNIPHNEDAFNPILDKQ